MFALVVFLCSLLFARFKWRKKHNGYEPAPRYEMYDSRERKLRILRQKIVSGYLHVPYTLKDLHMLIALNLIPDSRIDADLQNHLNECEHFLLCQEERNESFGCGDSSDEEEMRVEYIDLQNSKDWLCVPEL